MNGILGLFDLFSLLYLFRALQLLNRIRQQWASLLKNPLTQSKKQLAEQASFFVAVPPGVLIHELGHALAIWLFGGQVVEFGYRVFWGYVRPFGTFTLAQDWFISLAGTLGNLLFGLALWLALRRHGSAALRYFGLRAFRFQVYFALIYYPIFTVVLPIGDWTTIYNFGATPLLSGVTAVCHAALLLLFWYGDRVGWFEMPDFAAAADGRSFAALQEQANANPQDTRLQLQIIDALRRGGATNRASRRLDQLLAQQPHLADAYLQRAVLRSERAVSPAAAADLQQALQLGLSTPQAQIVAYQLLGQHYLDRDDAAQAAVQFDQALRLVAQQNGQTAAEHEAQLYYGRSQAQRRLRRYDLARRDINRAIELAADNQQALSRYRDEQMVIENHAKKTPEATSQP